MAQLLLDSDEPTEARRRALHQVKSGEMHLPACLAEWPLESAKAFGALTLRCCSAGDRDGRPGAAEVAAALRALLVEAQDGGVAVLAQGALHLAADGPAAAMAAAASAQPLPRAVTLSVELGACGAVTGGSVSLQLPHAAAATPTAAAATAATNPSPAPLRVAVSGGEWDGASGQLRVVLAAPAAPAPAVKAWPSEFVGTYGAGQLAGRWTYRAPQAGAGATRAKAGPQAARAAAAAPLQEAAALSFVSHIAAAAPACEGAVANPASEAATTTTGASSPQPAAIALAAARLGAANEGAKRCSRNALVEAAPVVHAT
jgi:hypothetical protein